jgi:hypothetical protein
MRKIVVHDEEDMIAMSTKSMRKRPLMTERRT